MKNQIKLFIAFALFFITSYSQAQTSIVYLSQQKIAKLDCDYERIVDESTNDTTYYIYLGFQNEKYSSIVDIHSIMFNAKDSVNIKRFYKDLKAALLIMETGQNKNWTVDYKYSIQIYDFNKKLYLESNAKYETAGYTLLNKKQVQNLINFLSSLQLEYSL